ncbi:hypothetical protein [Paraburkholderia fungorum]|uniref:Phasin domain-containing protein n=1 Tax=Paraburkholderia fungorum TaxID=134537 RepID=A0AAW3UW81_9BURK|nr:hypothetical protein [Paraburkholderia fungorum]MBB4514970.1 hypothetical protein [Paraburkholderia fungorum]MBB6202914.1 hypothetical protein [Paraburkholderia fungorum]
MAGTSIIPFDLYRVNLALALQMLSFSQEARQQACEFEMQRIRRDLAAANAIRNAASGVCDWNGFAVSCQTIARDYMETTTRLWQQGFASTVRLQNGCGEGLREALATWQSAWSEQWPTHVPMNPAMLPWQNWLRSMENTLANMPYGNASESGTGGHASSANSGNSARSPASGNGGQQGGQHVE